MVRNRPTLLIAGLMTLVLAACVFAQGQVWDFLGYTQVDGRAEYGKIEISRRACLFRTIQMRITGDAIFFDHILVHFDNGTYQNVVIGGRISSEQKEYVINLPGEGRALESVELFYFKEPWQHNPRVSLYGLRCPSNQREYPVASMLPVLLLYRGLLRARSRFPEIVGIIGK